MYRQRKDLEKLIESLNSGEKRYFNKQYISGIPEEELPLYLELYLRYEKGESQLSKKISQAGGRALTAAKTRLYDNILGSLVTLHTEHSLNMLIQSRLSAIELLLAKGLTTQALIVWRKLYTDCVANEKFSLLLQALDWEKRLNIVLDIPTRTTDEIKNMEDETIEKMLQVIVLERIYSHIMLLKRQYGFVKGKIKEKLDRETVLSEDMPSEDDCLSEKATYYYHLIHAIYCWMVMDHDKGYKSSKNLILRSASNILPNDYISGIFQHITSSVCLGKFQDTLNGITLAEDFLGMHHLDQSVSFKIQLFAYRATYHLIVYNYMGDRSKLIDVISETEAKLRQFGTLLPMELRQIVNGNLMNAYVGIGDLQKADRLWNEMNDKQYKEFREDVRADLFLFRLFSLLHSKSYSLIPSAALSALRFFKKSGIRQVEQSVAQYLLKEIDYANPNLLQRTIFQLRNYIGHITNDYPSGFQEHYTRYIIWCDAILNDEPYHKAARKWFLNVKD